MCVYRLSPIGLAANVGKKPSPAPQCLSKFSFLAFYSAPLSLSAPDLTLQPPTNDCRRTHTAATARHKHGQERAAHRRPAPPDRAQVRQPTGKPAPGQGHTCAPMRAYLWWTRGLCKHPETASERSPGTKGTTDFAPCKPCASQKYRYLWRAKVCIIYLSIIQLWQKKRLY